MTEREHSVTNTSQQHLRVSLRGKLSQDYVKLKNNSVEAASKWVRQLVRDATGGHPQLLFRLEPDPEHGQKLVIGLKSEVGKFGDW